MEFDYFYHREGERFSFYMLPKILLAHEFFKPLSSDAKILYSRLLERTSLSFKNNWLDEEKRIYWTIVKQIDTRMRRNRMKRKKNR